MTVPMTTPRRTSRALDGYGFGCDEDGDRMGWDGDTRGQRYEVDQEPTYYRYSVFVGESDGKRVVME